MTTLTELSLSELRDGLRRGSFSARELTLACFDCMSYMRNLNAFITETPDKALANAAWADSKLNNGTAGPLEGVPISVKDMFCTEGIRTTVASKILETFVPTYESTVTAKLRRGGFL